MERTVAGAEPDAAGSVGRKCSLNLTLHIEHLLSRPCRATPIEVLQNLDGMFKQSIQIHPCRTSIAAGSIGRVATAVLQQK